jgi:phosphatidylglycerophosphatase C|tara:strand:+ start:3073 stop:3684 length:612 start_codon:yes stop_codon:yes gene_type:complete
MNVKPNIVTVFDFDETLVLENSLGYLFEELANKAYWTAAIPAVIKSFLCLNFGYKLRLNVKKSLYKRHLKGCSESVIYQAGTSAAGRLTINIKVMDQLKLANELGETIIIATASPRVYVSAILDKLGVPRSKVIGTEVDLGTGHISGGECSREAKWDAVREELKTLQVSTIKAYGNAPDDLFMLKQVDQGFLVKGSLIRLSKM